MYTSGWPYQYDNIVNNFMKMIVWNNFFDEKNSDGSSVSSIDKEKVSAPTMMRLSPPRLWHLIMNL